ncbi:MAG: hypothetical protein GX561_02265 [Lentisphaerae bacterium]|nr:hypothetical protein [Lentisphaerota bacterium]
MGVSKTKQAAVAKEAEHVEFFDKIKKANPRLDSENRERAETKKKQAEKKYTDFRARLAEHRLIDKDDRGSRAFMRLAESPAQSEMLRMIEKIIRDNFEETSATTRDGMAMEGMEGGLMGGGMMGGGMMGGGMMGGGMRQPGMMANMTPQQHAAMIAAVKAKQEAAAKGEKADENAVTITETKEVEEPKRHLLKMGQKVSPYLTFDRYAAMKNGLNKDDMERIYKQLKVVELVIGLVRESEVDELSEFSLPKGIEKMEEGDYEWTPMTMTVVGQEVNIQRLLNILSSNDKYFFFIRSLELDAPDVLLDQIAELKESLAKEMQAIQSASRSRSAGFGYGQVDGGMMGVGTSMMEEGMMMGGRTGGRRSRRSRRTAAQEAAVMPGMRPGMPGMMPGAGTMEDGGLSMMNPYDLIPMTRKDLRVFDNKKDVTMTIRFDLIEFNHLAENN